MPGTDISDRERLVRVEEGVKHILEKLDGIVPGAMAKCVEHADRVRYLSERLDKNEREQEWLRRQWTITWMGIGASVAIILISYAFTKMGIIG